MIGVTKLHLSYLDNQVTRNRYAIAGNGRAVSPRVSADASRQRLTRDWYHSPCSTNVHRGNSTNRAPVMRHFI